VEGRKRRNIEEERTMKEDKINLQQSVSSNSHTSFSTCYYTHDSKHTFCESARDLGVAVLSFENQAENLETKL